MDRGSWYSTAAGAAVAALLIMSHLTASPWISAGDWTVIMVLGLFLIATEGLRESGYLQGLVVGSLRVLCPPGRFLRPW